MSAEYKKLPEWWLFWCNTHQRRATHAMYRPGMKGVVCCDPALGGIMMHCFCVDLTDIAVLVDKNGMMCCRACHKPWEEHGKADHAFLIWEELNPNGVVI